MEKSKLKLEYKKLVRDGKSDIANAKLRKIQGLFKEDNKKEIINAKPEIFKLKKQKIEKESLDDLVKIKGIGKKTIKDIKRIYNSVDELKKAISEDKVPLLDNIVKKLRNYFEE